MRPWLVFFHSFQGWGFSRSKIARANTVFCGRSTVISRTTILVSTASMTTHHLPPNGGANPARRPRFALWAQAADHLSQRRLREESRRTQENGVPGGRIADLAEGLEQL